MSESEAVTRSRPRTRSMFDSRAKSTSPTPGTTKKESFKTGTKMKSIIIGKSPKSRSTSRSSADSDMFYDSQENQSDSELGLLPILKNLQFGTHIALRKTDNDVRKNADRIIKRDSNTMLEQALKQERAKMSSQIMNFLVEGSSTSESDLPQLQNHDAMRLSCSQEEFDRTFKSLGRSHPRFEGKSSELLYFLMELAELRTSRNLTDIQVQRVMQNRLAGRLLVYFLAELKRDDVTSVVNRLGQDFIETINTADEVEHYLNFKFTFKNLSSELTSLKQSISLAHPNITRQALSQKFLVRVITLLPFEQRHSLLDDISHRQRLVDNGILEAPYTDHDLEGRILFHCRALDKKIHKNVFKLEEKNNFDQNPPSKKQESETNSDINNLVAAIKQISDGKVTNNFWEQPQRGSPGGYPERNFNQREQVLLASPKDPQYENWVKEIRESKNYRFLGEKIQNDIKNSAPKFRDILNQIRLSKPVVPEPCRWQNGRYSIADCQPINFPVFRKIGNRSPDLTIEALKHFSRCCYACGLDQCEGKSSNSCAYHSKPDSWIPCTQCKMGFHLSGDCLAQENN